MAKTPRRTSSNSKSRGYIDPTKYWEGLEKMPELKWVGKVLRMVPTEEEALEMIGIFLESLKESEEE